MENLDNDIRIAFSLHSSPGAYALLLGSGISSSAGILTGWGIVLDLISRISSIENESPFIDPEKWYIEKYNETPDYSKLLDKLTRSSVERKNLLHQYFEPDEHDREEGLKLPTQAHKSIAGLVKCGYIRVILTTNFDRLLEKAIEGEGITPTVISTDDSIKGSIPFVHNQCTIIKLHGDYMDTRIKNTPEELAQYSKELDGYIDRIFEDFGLIICGWSAEWDKALRDALYRRKNRRFSTYWTVRGQICDEAVRLSNHLNAEKVTIKGADEFFSTLFDNIDAIRKFSKFHPLSADLAVAKVKKYLPEEKYSIKLHEMVKEELDRVCLELSSDRFKTNLQAKLTLKFYIKRIHEYEELMRTLIKILITLVYYDNGRNIILITDTIERVLQTQRFYGNVSLVNLQRYPVILLFKSIGVISVKLNNYNILSTVLLKTRYNGYSSHRSGKKSTLLEEFDEAKILDLSEKIENIEPENYVMKVVQNYVENYIPNKDIFEENYDIFEYLTYLMYINLEYKDPSLEKIHGNGYRLARKYYSPRHLNPEFIYDFFHQGLKEGKEWSLLKTGFFNSSPEQFEACFKAYKKYLEDWGSTLY